MTSNATDVVNKAVFNKKATTVKTTKTKTMPAHRRPRGMQSALSSDRTHRVFHGVLQGLSTEQRGALIDRIAIVTDDAQKATAAGGHAVGRACVKATAAGDVLFLDSTALVKFGVDYVAAAVAHELAHVALGHTRQSAKSAEQYEQDEIAADNLAGAWGYRQLVKESYRRAAGL